MVTVPAVLLTFRAIVPGLLAAKKSITLTGVIATLRPVLACKADGLVIEGPVRRMPTTCPPSDREGNALANQAFARFSYSNQHQYSPSPLGPILDGDYGDGNDTIIGENFVGSETHIFNPSLINEFRVGYNFGKFTEKQFNANQDISEALGLGGVPFSANLGGLVNASISGISGFGTPYYYPTLENEHVLELLDNVTRIIGNHSLKFGVDFQRINTSELQPVIATGAYNYTGQYTGIPGVANTGSGVADFLADEMNSATLGIANFTNDHRWMRSAYGQDDWRVTQKLTLNLGLRYDYFGPRTEDNGEQANFYATASGIGTGTGTFEVPNNQQNAVPQSFLSILSQNDISVASSNNPSLVNPQNFNFRAAIRDRIQHQQPHSCSSRLWDLLRGL